MREKREFAQCVLNYLQDKSLIMNWESSGSENRHDYTVNLPSGRVAVIELKGCLDGNNTNIFERPPHAHEFVMWSVCTNPGADPRHNAWSGIHTRLSAEIISRAQRVDGLVIWDMVCGTIGRPCPKIVVDPSRIREIAHYRLPPPCIYLFPDTIPSPRNNPSPSAQPLQNVEILAALAKGFQARAEEMYAVNFTVAHAGSDTVRTTTIKRDGVTIHQSTPTAIRRA
jgi:hypothetical protein